MNLIFCRQEPVKRPYYIDVLEIRIHFSQELCCTVHNHSVLTVDDFLDDLLVGLICKDLDTNCLARWMEKPVGTGTRPEEILALFLSECDYYNDKGIQKFKQTIVALRTLHPARYEKQRADCMFGQQQYGKAAARYSKILEYPRDGAVKDLFLIKACNNLRTCYVMMFQFHRTLGCYDRTYELGKDDALLKHIYFPTVFTPELDVKDKYQSVFTDEHKRTWSEEMDLAMLETRQVEEAKALGALFKKDPIKRMNGATKMVRR